MNRIAEQLWNLQLGVLSHHGIQFSWGGVEAEEEPLDEAVAAATERMRDTRRGRHEMTTHGVAPSRRL